MVGEAPLLGSRWTLIRVISLFIIVYWVIRASFTVLGLLANASISGWEPINTNILKNIGVGSQYWGVSIDVD